MTVKKFIAELQKLDQDRKIWVVYDNTYVWAPEAEIINEDMAARCSRIKVGDYAIFAG